MKLLPRSALVTSVVAAGLLAIAGPGRAYAGCALANLGSRMSVLGDRPGGSRAAMPNRNALGGELGGLGAIALGGGALTLVALLTGGSLLLRQRWLAQETEALETEVDLCPSTETETVLVSEPAEIESEVALAYRR